MWEGFEARLEENERERHEPLRKALFDVLRSSGLRPGGGVTKKVLSFEFAANERLLWGIENSARNIYLDAKWEQHLATNGIASERRVYRRGLKDGGRHTALSRDWSFGESDCVVVQVDGADQLRRLIGVVLGQDTAMSLNPAAVARWVGKLRRFFPGLDRFDRPDPQFDERERAYKLEVARDLRATIDKADTDQGLIDAIHTALAKSNLLQWRSYWAISPKGDGDRSRLGPSLRALVAAALGPVDGRPEALAAFGASWIEAAPKGSPDQARQIAEFLYLHLAPDDGIYIRHSVRQDFWLEGFGSPFPVHSSLADTYRDELRFMRAVRQAFEEKGLAPRDMIDVQSALWIVHNYKNSDAILEGQPTMITGAISEMQSPTNLILYGPPGTGKTYATVWEAVLLCLGEPAAERLRNDRDGLMSEYRRLVGEGRIEFVTFHQSFSYEDFVEGLRPTVRSEQEGDEEAQGAGSGGFSLRPHPGVFKLISDRARLDVGDAPSHRLDRSKPIYKIALGRRGSQEDRIREGLDDELIHLGWGGDIDWSDERFDDFEEIRREWNDKKDVEASGKDPNIEMTYAFRSGLQVGDYVVVSDGRDSYRAFGRVTGEYFFDPSVSSHPHRRSVEWIWRNDDNGAERSTFYGKYFRRQAAYRLDPDEIDWDGLEAVVVGPSAQLPVAGARPHVIIIDEINRANISKVFGELITLLEVDKRLGSENEVTVKLPYSGTSFGVPSNLHIIATMNTADRSIALLDTALRRRFSFRELMPDTGVLRTALAAKQLDAENLDGIDLCALMRTINERIEYLFDREHQIGHAYFTGCRSRSDVEDVMRQKVIPLLAEYFYEDWSKVATVLGDGEGTGSSGFIEAKKLAAPAGLASDELGGDKLRWQVKDSFDFSEFAV